MAIAAGFVAGVAAFSLDLSIFDVAISPPPSLGVNVFNIAAAEGSGEGSVSSSPVVPQRDASTPAPTMDEMKRAFDQVAEDGVVQPGLLLPVLRRRNPQATEADAQSLIEMMRSNEDEDVSFSGVCRACGGVL